MIASTKTSVVLLLLRMVSIHIGTESSLKEKKLEAKNKENVESKKTILDRLILTKISTMKTKY